MTVATELTLYNCHTMRKVTLSLSRVNTKSGCMNPICRINQAIKQFKGDLSRISEYCKQRGILISREALEARIKSH